MCVKLTLKNPWYNYTCSPLTKNESAQPYDIMKHKTLNENTQIQSTCAHHSIPAVGAPRTHLRHAHDRRPLASAARGVRARVHWWIRSEGRGRGRERARGKKMKRRRGRGRGEKRKQKKRRKNTIPTKKTAEKQRRLKTHTPCTVIYSISLSLIT